MLNIYEINKKLLRIADYCGTFSGKGHDKFWKCGLKKIPGHEIDVPLIVECPINIECLVEKIIKLRSHDLFIGRVLYKLIDDNISYPPNALCFGSSFILSPELLCIRL